ncbi:hypothetical protein ACFXGA_07320 [Actinosynnema sp. NPDC059335]|uniref:hypothetical protein n=1 Tax=Actinosynnema sp. NPDC059335 TaxID=3346804 RepID=UPI003670A9A5
MIEDGRTVNQVTGGAVAGPVVQAGRIDAVHFHSAPRDGRWLWVVAAALSSVTASSVWLSVHRTVGGVEGVLSGCAVVAAVVALVLLAVVLGRRDRRPAVDVGEARTRLAAAVSTQWHGEWVGRGMLRSPPLPVAWSARGRAERSDLDGPVTAARLLPVRRLVVVGPGGSGKTVLAVRLTLDLLAHRRADEPVPVPLALALWDPERQVLRDWIAGRLEADYGITGGAELVAAGAVLPVLDGLDEVAEPLRAVAVEAVNAQLGPTDPVVLTSRPDPALAGLAGVTTFELAGVDVTDAVAHLGGGWRRVAVHPPVAAALTSPLMVSLARSVPRPDDLLDLPDEASVRVFLLESFIAETYSDRARPAGAARRPRHRGPGPRRWLGFLARHLERRGTPNFAWWELRGALPVGRLEVGVGVLAGLVWAGVAALLGPRAIGLGVGPVVGLLFGAAFCVGYAAVRTGAPPHRGGSGDGGFRGLPTWADVAWRLRHGALAIAVAWVVAAGVTGGRASAGRPAGAPVAGVIAGLSAALLAGLVVGVVAGALLRGAEGLDARVATVRARTPDATLRRDRVSTVVVGTMFAVVVGVITGGAVGIAAGDLGAGAWAAVGGAVAGGPAAVVVFTAWAAYVPARVWLALRRDLPWRLGAFLADAHRLEVLRQFGTTYQFRHLALRERLARPPVGNGHSVR